MIPTKDKNLLLLPVTDGGVTQPFNMKGFAGYNANKATHNGLDIGWCNHQYADILACQDGTVMAVLNNNSSVGNAIVLQHDYDDGTHRWTGYIHLQKVPTLKVGASVKQGDKVGVRGGSPYVNGKAKYGVHLHLYVTKPVTVKYTWDNMKANVVDPYPLLYRSKAIKYDRINDSLLKLPLIEEARVEVAKPVERDELKNQLMEKSSNLRVRMQPNLKGTIIGFLPSNVYYDWYDVVQADGYHWYQIEANQWVAQTGSMVILPARDKAEMLEEENAKLKGELETTKKYLAEATATVEKLTGRIISIRELTHVD